MKGWVLGFVTKSNSKSSFQNLKRTSNVDINLRAYNWILVQKLEDRQSKNNF